MVEWGEGAGIRLDLQFKIFPIFFSDFRCLYWEGIGISDRAKVLVSSNIEGVISKDWKWPLDVVLRILRLGNSGNCVLSINDQGLLQIKVDSGLGDYTYLLPAKS